MEAFISPSASFQNTVNLATSKPRNSKQAQESAKMNTLKKKPKTSLCGKLTHPKMAMSTGKPNLEKEDQDGTSNAPP